jgi:hypothetical protein
MSFLHFSEWPFIIQTAGENNEFLEIWVVVLFGIGDRD